MNKSAEDVPCPRCGELVNHNAIACRFCEHGLSHEHFKHCPLCAETVRLEASVCRHCHGILADNAKNSNHDAHEHGMMLRIGPRLILGTDAEIDRLEHLLKTDALTQLYNWRTMRHLLTAECKRAERYNRPVSLAVIKLGDFDNIVRQCGTESVEGMLKTIANLLYESIRCVDAAAYKDNGQFAVILPETSAQDAAVAAERIRLLIRAQSITQNWQTVKLLVGVGLASYPLHSERAAEVISMASSACDAALNDGGNEVRLV